MMVTFVSQCEKKALLRTRRVLDAFANRIGSNTWQTVITEDGLIAVKNLLRKTATKNTAVSCHWLRSRSRSELVWIVGNRDQFNREGNVPISRTEKNVMQTQWENNWNYLPEIKALVAIAALLHDWGKASKLFQEKLRSGKKKISDPLRHEWISCILLKAFVEQSGNSDEGWLSFLSEGKIDEKKLKKLVNSEIKKPLDNLPPLAQLVAWLVVTHHRLPFLYENKSKDFSNEESARDSISKIFEKITDEWGYKNNSDQELKNCFEFSEGLLSNSEQWIKQIKKWSQRLLQSKEKIENLIENGGYRLLLHHARLCLMLGDHYYSSLDADAKEKWDEANLYANTDKAGLKQKLDEHLVKVGEHALKISQTLSRFTSDMDFAHDIKNLKQKSPKGFKWQDKAVEAINFFRNKQEKNCGYFVVNIASTGCGKTIANAKIMRALSKDGESLRYILALGLRTLTLQTGDEYRNRIGLGNDELAVLIGSAAIKELHEKSTKEDDKKTFEDFGSESLEELLDEDLYYEDVPNAEFLNAVIKSKKHKAFLHAPVLACTIDHIIAATETTRGGKYILPYLRLLSSDLVIDEIDDFDGKDLVAIGRLIHLAGMLGRKVMISSATIPPALAEGLYNAYQEGWKLHVNFHGANKNISCVWIDEFSTEIEIVGLNDCKAYQDFHKKFISKRVLNLEKQTAKRKGFIVHCDELLDEKDQKQNQYFEKIRESAISLHKKHFVIDEKTKKQVSFGVIRVANIKPCVELTQYLLEANWEENFAPKIMAYHSRQVLLIRSKQEKHLDAVLKCKKGFRELDNIDIRSHLDSTEAKNVIFILVATPVEEIGRDHDFDWAIIEPSSYRSIIQLSGRVRRHRVGGVDAANIAIMQYNLRGLKKEEISYRWPGYETSNSLALEDHNLCKLIDESTLNSSINSIPRIQESKTLEPKYKLADLEHQSIKNTLTNYQKFGAFYLQGYLKECWWLTALPHQLNRFRSGADEDKMYLVWQNGRINFCRKNERGEFIIRNYEIKISDLLSANAKSRLWLNKNYEQFLLQEITDCEEFEKEKEMEYLSKRYGEISVRENEKYFYNDQFGLWRK